MPLPPIDQYVKTNVSMNFIQIERMANAILAEGPLPGYLDEISRLWNEDKELPTITDWVESYIHDAKLQDPDVILKVDDVLRCCHARPRPRGFWARNPSFSANHEEMLNLPLVLTDAKLYFGAVAQFYWLTCALEDALAAAPMWRRRRELDYITLFP